MPTVTIQTACTGKTFVQEAGGVIDVLAVPIAPNVGGWKSFVADVKQVSVKFDDSEIPRILASKSGIQIYDDENYNYLTYSEPTTLGQGRRWSYPPYSITAKTLIDAKGLGDPFGYETNIGGGNRLNQNNHTNTTPGKPLLYTNNPSDPAWDNYLVRSGMVSPTYFHEINFYTYGDSSQGSCVGFACVPLGTTMSDTGWEAPYYKILVFFTNLDQYSGVVLSGPAGSVAGAGELHAFGLANNSINSEISSDCLGVVISTVFDTRRGPRGAGSFPGNPNGVYVVKKPPNAAYKIQSRCQPDVNRPQTFGTVHFLNYTAPWNATKRDAGSLSPQTIRTPCGHILYDNALSNFKHGQLPALSEWCVEGKSTRVLFDGLGVSVAQSKINQAFIGLNPDLSPPPHPTANHPSPVLFGSPDWTAPVIKAYYYNVFGELIGSSTLTLSSYGDFSPYGFHYATHTPPANAVRVRYAYLATAVTYTGDDNNSYTADAWIVTRNVYQELWGDQRYATTLGDWLPGMYYERVIV